MAPVTATSTGIARQIIDDPALISLLERLSTFENSKIAWSSRPKKSESTLEVSATDDFMANEEKGDEDVKNVVDGSGPSPPFDIDGFVAELDKCPSWRFQEQADLYEWIRPLNAMDSALTYFIETYPSILLIPRKSINKSRVEISTGSDHAMLKCQNDDVESVPSKLISIPENVTHSLNSILRFLSNLLRNATNKSIFNSVDELSDLLAATNDDIAALALEALSNLAAPPMLHRQQAPETQQHTTALHSSPANSMVMWRLMALAKGWGSKGSGLGLLACVKTDDSTEGRGTLPKYAGEVSFECYISSPDDGTDTVDATSTTSGLISVYVSTEDMFAPSPSQEQQAEKRRKTGKPAQDRRLPISGASSRVVKSTAELFHYSIDKIEENGHNRDQIPPEKLFFLLADIRLARSFHSSKSRTDAVERRLRALTCILHSHPSQETVSAYFLAQPELCSELVDLVRPTVSSTSASSFTVGESNSWNFGSVEGSKRGDVRRSSILSLADSPVVPYVIRSLAIETLTALVARRDATGTLTSVAKQVNVLGELGVGKGQYLGLLPTLIRHSLAALNSFLLNDGSHDLSRPDVTATETSDNIKINEESCIDVGLELGLAFLKASKPPQLPLKDREERALEFIDAVLTLTSAVVSVPSGTAALTDCGIIPALVSTIALDSQVIQNSPTHESPFSDSSDADVESYSDCLLKFISAQAIQIIEGAIVTHNNALAAFYELHGIDVLVQRLSVEVKRVKKVPFSQSSNRDNDVVMEDATMPGNLITSNHSPRHNLQASRRVLLFSAVNCLTVVFHQHETGAATPVVPAGGAQLRKPELLHVLTDIMDNVNCYGGVLAALVATLLSDVMNSDPQIVHYVHSSGLAKSFFDMILGKDIESRTSLVETVETWSEPMIEPSAELIMAIPNVISALSLTESGMKVVTETNPFPTLLSVFCSPKFAMPNSRCLLNEMSAIVGTGLDEIMRHNPSLRNIVLKAIVQVMKRIVFIGKNLITLEDARDFGISAPSSSQEASIDVPDLEVARTHLMQYGYNITQLLEQILHNEDHIPHFIEAGGFDLMLDLALWSTMPGGRQVVAHISCLSSPSISNVTHSSTSSTLSAAVKTIATHHDPQKLIKLLAAALESRILHLSICIKALRNDRISDDTDKLMCDGLTEPIPCVPLHDLQESEENYTLIHNLSTLFRSIISVDWLVNSLATVVKAACQRSNDAGVGLGRSEREWKKEISSKSFEHLINQLSLLHRSALAEVCKVRTEPEYDQRELVRNRRSTQHLVYKIRIVCQEGAIVRNGIDIDDCENVGNLEMGEIVEAYDRCINSSGVLRYQTRRGWVSEQTRGHGRDQIAEILDLRTRTGSIPFLATSVINKKLKRIECGIPDLRSTCASIMSRLHGSQVNLFSSLERFMVSGIRASSLRDRSQSQSNSINSHVQSLIRTLSTNLKKDFEFIPKCGSSECAGIARDAAICMYYGNIFNLFHACLYEEKRERRFFNTPLLLSFLALGGWKAGIFQNEVERDDKIDPITTECGFVSAIRFVLQHVLQDVEFFAIKEKSIQHKNVQIAKQDGESHHSLHQRVSRVVASSFPPILSLLRRLMSRSLLIDSQMSTMLTKMKPSDLEFLLSNVATPDKTNQTPSFNAYCFTRELHLKLAEVSFNTLSDRRFAFAPAHIVYPWMNFMGEIISSLEEAGKPRQITNTHENPTSSRVRSPLSELSDYNQRLARNLSSMSVLLGRPGARPIERSTEPFEPSEASIARLSEMGFTRDHAIEALESTGTNRVEIAMEYALTHPPSSPATRERRRAAREERRLQRERLISSLVERSSNADRNATGRESSFVNDNSAPEPSSNTDEHAETNNDTHSRSSTDNEVAKSYAVADEKVKLQEEIKMEKEMAANAKRCLDSIKESFTRISLNIIEGSSKVENSLGVSTTNTETGLLHDDRGPDGDSDGVTVVMCNFLLDLCTRYPSEIPKISNEILRRLKSMLHVESPSHCRVKVGCEASFAAVAHASVIFFRALPKSRPLVLRHGLVGCLTHCVRNVTLTSALRSGKDSSPHQMNWPRWLSPVLLLLEVMAQPTAVSLDETEDEDENGNSKSASKKGEFGRVLAEHKKQSATLAKATRQVFSAIHKDPTIPIKKKKGKDSEVKKKAADAEQCESRELSQSTNKAGAHSATVSSIPHYLPLILPETAEACMLLCLQLLGLRSKKCPDKALLARVCPPPTVVHAILLLLVRVLHSQKLALTCLQMGGTDLILSLPRYCRFKGNSGLITMILRRLLEDEPTLQTMMETEIRSLVSKLWKKQRRGSSSETERPKSNLKQFMQAATPIICRDPLVFMKAFASSVKFETQTTESNDKDSLVVLLSTEERAKNTKLMNVQTITGTTCSVHTPNGKKSEDDQSRRGKINQNDKSQSKPLRSKSPRRTATSRRGISPKSTPQTKKERPEGQYSTSHKTAKKQFHLEGTPANHVVSLLLREIFSAFPHFNGRYDNDGEEPFLAIPDQLDILSDLVLAIPACAAAIHRFKPPTRILNAISSCTEPPQTAVSFLLHYCIPQPRTLIQHKPGKNTDCSHNNAKKCFMKSRISQSAARLIVCLVARSGEGRRRVISDLIFALSCGHCVDNKSWSRGEMELVEQNAPNEEIEMWALQSWGELCIGLAAPRSDGANQDSNSLLSFEVVRIMLDCGVAHALMFALQRIKLYHPMASSVSSALVRPLEIFTRGSVFKTIEAMEEKEYSKTKIEPATLDRESRRTTFGPSHRSESAFADDAMLEEGFDIETAERHVRRAARQNYDDIVVDRDVNYSESDNGDDDDDVMIDDIDIDESDSDDENDSTDEDGEIEVQLRNVDYSDPDDIDSEDDEEISSNSSDDEDSDGEDGMDDSDDEMNDDSDNDGSERDDDELFLEGNQGEMLEEEEGWSRDNDDFFEWSATNDVNNEVEGILGDSDVDDGMEGWTRVDGENMVLNVMRSPGHGNHSNRHRGFMIDTAEAVLGNILRSGDLQMDSLSEIEQTLGMQGIRFMHNQREGRSGMGIHIGGTNMSRTLNGNSNNASGISSTSVGTGPAVHQNVPPDFYSLSGIPSNRSLMESNPMEFIFGGPAACAGSECYDLTLSSRAEIRPRFSLPSTYDTQLFPGGIAASIHRGHVEQFSLHPLLCTVELPPLNSMVSTVPPIGHRALLNELPAGTVGATGTFVASPNGNIIRVHSRQLNPSGADQLTGRVGGNIFDGSLIDRASEVYSLSFGHALNALFSNENSTTEPVRNETTASNNHLDTADNVGNDFSRENAMASAGQSPPSLQNDLNNTFDATEEAGALSESDDNLRNPSHGPSSGPGPFSETSNSADVGENEANVASSLATGLTISQPDANDSHVSCNDEPNVEIEPDANHAGDEEIQEECSEDPPTMSATHTSQDNSPTTETACDDATNNAQNDGASRAIDELVLNCPPNVDPEVFNSLPIEMQQEIIEQHETTNAVAAQIGETSGLDPEALAALPEDMRREIIQQEQQQQQHRNRERTAADPANAEEMDNASFLASLAPDLRAEILLTADDAFLNSLPPDIIAEAQIIRERATTQQRRRAEEASNASNALGASTGVRAVQHPHNASQDGHATNASRGRRTRNGKLRVEVDRPKIVYTPPTVEKNLGPLLTSKSTKSLLRLLYLLSPIQPQRVLQKLFLNICLHAGSRKILLDAFVSLLNDDVLRVTEVLNSVDKSQYGTNLPVGTPIQSNDVFPPYTLIGTAPDLPEIGSNTQVGMFRRRPARNSAAAVAASLPASARGSSYEESIPPVVARRIISFLSYLTKASPRICVNMLSPDGTDRIEEVSTYDRKDSSCLERLIDLLHFHLYTKSATNLEQLLNLLESTVAPLSLLPKDTESDFDVSNEKSSPGKEWIKVPKIVLSKERLHLLCSVLRLESCKDSSFMKVNTLTRRLSRIEYNRECILDELALVAQGLGADSIRDLKSVSIRLSAAASLHQQKSRGFQIEGDDSLSSSTISDTRYSPNTPSTAVSLSTSSSELKLLRVLQTLHSLCNEYTQDEATKGDDGNTPEFIALLRSLDLEALWDQLAECLRKVSILEGVAQDDEVDDNELESDGNDSDAGKDGLEGKSSKKLQNSVAGLITRFLPAIEAFFIVNTVSISEERTIGSSHENTSQDKSRLLQFVASNKILLNALLRSNPHLLEKGLKAMVQTPKCRPFLDFDVKRQWFKTQVRRLRQQASRRHGSLRLSLRRKHVFEDAFHAFIHRNAEELRGRLHITFQNEEGVDAGGLSREFFAILAKEMFNPNYALFMSTEDGCTFQPNPNSSINPDDLRYFRFVGRIVGKAVVDGFLLDAHFTRSLYKHMLGIKPTHQDMQAIDPDYYKNLQMILQHNLEDIGLELTFSTEDHSFGRSQTLDLIPNGRNIPVTEETKARYVDLVCEHRMTTAIEKQIKAYLEGFHEMVDPDLISIFTAKELELLISGMPDIDIDDLKKNTEYNGYRPADKEIGWFWNIMFSLSRSEKAAFLQFVTGSSKVPLAGFSELQGMRGVQKFSINKASGSAGALMSAHTCFNALDLPVYKSEDEMKEKLLYAISEGGGGFLFA